jgi:hypothetical protein
LERIINTGNIAVLNDPVPTHFNVQNGTFSALDLCLVTPALLSELSWSVVNDLHGSDHFPIRVAPLAGNNDVRLRATKWNLKKADWKDFAACFDNRDTTNDKSDSVSTLASHFTEHLIAAAGKTIPKTKVTNHTSVPWWNQDCKNSIRDRKRLLRKFRRNCTLANLIEFKKARAKARLTINTSKRGTWQCFVSSINRQTPIKIGRAHV